jgi:hypothetical protein
VHGRAGFAKPAADEVRGGCGERGGEQDRDDFREYARTGEFDEQVAGGTFGNGFDGGGLRR